MKSFIKEVPKVKDKILIKGGQRGERTGGLRSVDGSPIDLEIIAKAFGVDLEEAKEISRRLSL